MCVMRRVGAAPCQWRSPGSKKTRAPGVKWTAAAPRGEAAAIASMWTVPLNHSAGPWAVSRLFLVISICHDHSSALMARR